MINVYKIADLVIRISIPEGMKIPENLSLFQIPESVDLKIDQSYTLQFFETDALIEEANQRAMNWQDGQRFDRENLIIFAKRGRECRFIFFGGSNLPYAVCEEISEKETVVSLHAEHWEMFQYDTIFSSVLSMERHLLTKGSVILHSAYMYLDGEAVLFSAPSGTGKSTQAGLWEKYRGTRQVNGDASILNKKDGRWFANGFQICGSSEICYNESWPIKAIVMLYQAKENVCRRMTAMEAFMKLYEQIKINTWNADFQNQVMGMVEELLAGVPVFELGCDISEDAVCCLEKAFATLND